MISKQRHAVWTMLAAFLLVIAHDLTPHSHSFLADSPAFTAELPAAEDPGLFESLVEFDLGADHLEHFSPASALSFGENELQKCDVRVAVRLPEQLRLLHFPVSTPFDPDPLLHPVFLSTQYLFRGPPSSEA